MKQKSIKIALSEKVRSNNLKAVDEIKLSQKKTKEFVKALEKLDIKKSVLIGFSEKEKDLYLCCRNLKSVVGVPISTLNVVDMLNCKYLMLSKNSIKYLEEKYGTSRKPQAISSKT